MRVVYVIMDYSLSLPQIKNVIMRKILVPIIVFIASLFLLSSCDFLGGEPEPNEFNVEYLYGTWQSNTLFEKYAEDGTGATWDTSDDVTEEEAQAFTWTLSYEDLTQIHIMEVGADVPRAYKVKELTESVLTYEDINASPKKSYSFSKVVE